MRPDVNAVPQSTARHVAGGCSRLLALTAALLLSAAASAQTVPACTTDIVGGGAVNGISGSDESNVIAVGDGGTIYIEDGSGWTAMPSPVGDDLVDVEVVDSNTAFAVGDSGTVLRFDGSSWVDLSGFTGVDLTGVWAASATEAWAVGDNGRIFAYDGSTWTDQSAAAGTNSDTLVDVWGDAAAVWVLGEGGELYRFDRASSSWTGPIGACRRSNDFGDLWGDGAGNLYLTWRDRVFRYNGTTCSSIYNSAANEDMHGLYGSSVTGEIHAGGDNGVNLYFNGSAWQEATITNQTINDVWVSDSGSVYFAADGGEIISCVRAGTAVEFVINHDNNGIHCVDEPVDVTVVNSLTGVPRTDYATQVTLDTQTGAGNWSLLAGSGTLTDATPDDGIATYEWPLGEDSAQFALSYREGTATFDIDVYQTSDAGMRDTDAEGLMTFGPSGFTVTAAPLANPPPALIAPFAATQTAGIAFPVYLTAFGQTPTDPSCGVIESYDGARDLQIWNDYVDPGTGSVAVTVDGLAVAASEAAAGTQSVTFSNGQATLTARYKDVGLLRLNFNDDGVTDPDLPNGIRGATAAFVSRPFTFLLSAIEDPSANPNPAAADASGPAFVAAGTPFSVTVTALDADGDATPNYGQESIPESVTLAATLVSPAGGNSPPLANAAGFGAFAGGQASGAAFGWPEVGIITLTPSVADADYLGAGDVAGPPSANVGRFFPDHFTAALNAPAFATGCVAGSFTWIGERFGYATEPVITVTARAAGGTPTLNYQGAYFRIDNTTLLNRSYTATSGILDLAGLPPTSADPVIAELGNGVGTLTFTAGSGLAFTRGVPEAPFAAEISLAIDVFDTDAVAALGNPVTFAAGVGMLFNAGNEMRFGRVRLLNAIGSERVDLALPMRSEYFDGAATGFVINADDACASGVSLSLGAFTGNLGPGETCVIENGSPGDSGAACAAAGPAGLRYREPPLGGDFNLYLRAPGDGNDGSTTVTADVPAWLRFDWDVALPGDENPAGTATFGIYRGEDRRIYTRELY